jgi:thiamine pyrophosphate-dependent acetolactate synthase large subunit-like protein
VIAITGLVARQLTGPGSIQEIDQYSFFEPICVFNKVLMSEDQTTSLGTLAVKHAILERGVSHIGVPNDVQKLPYESEVKPFKGRVPNMAFCQSVKLVKEAAELIDAARRPVIVAGFGVMGQAVELLQFANKISAPIVTTYRAKGLVNGSEPLYVGCHGGIGTTAAAKLVQTADLLLVVGSSYSDMTNIPEKRTVQIDIDPMMIAKKYPVEVGLVGNCSELVPMLRDLVSENVKDDYLREIKDLKEQWLKVLEGERDPNSTPIRPQYIMEVLSEEVADDAVLSIDVGENAWWFGRNFQMKSTQKMILSGYLASMGFGLPGAMAATVAYPDRQAVCITGDGGFAMVMGDFMTCVKYRMPVKVFVLNNSQLGMIMQVQKVYEYKNWQTELHNVDFAEYARSCGGVGLKVTEPNKLREVVKKALTSEGPVIVDILTDPKRF